MWAERTAALPRSARPRERPAKESLLLTEELIAQFLLEKERRGCVSDTVSGYRRHLLQLYQELPEDKEIRPGTLENWQSMLVEKGCAARTVNNWLSAANSLMESFRSAIRGLQRWIADLSVQKQLLLDALEKAKEPTLSNLLVDYFNLRNEQRNDWSGKEKLK